MTNNVETRMSEDSNHGIHVWACVSRAESSLEELTHIALREIKKAYAEAFLSTALLWIFCEWRRLRVVAYNIWDHRRHDGEIIWQNHLRSTLRN